MAEGSQRSIYQALKRKAEIVIGEPDAYKTRKLDNRRSSKPRIEFNGSDTDADVLQSSQDCAMHEQLDKTTHFKPAIASTSEGFYGNTLQRQRTPYFFDSHSDSDEGTMPRSSPISDTSTTIGSSSSVVTSSTADLGSLTPPSIPMERLYSAPASTSSSVQQKHHSSQSASISPTSSTASSQIPLTISPTITSAAIEIHNSTDSSNLQESDADADDDTSEDEDQDDKVELEMEQLRYMREQKKLHIRRLHQKQAEEKAQAELLAAQEKASLEALAAVGKANHMNRAVEEREQHSDLSSTKPTRPHTVTVFGQTWRQNRPESGGMARVSFEQAAALMRRHEPRHTGQALNKDSAAMQKIRLQAQKDAEISRFRPVKAVLNVGQIAAQARRDAAAMNRGGPNVSSTLPGRLPDNVMPVKAIPTKGVSPELLTEGTLTSITTNDLPQPSFLFSNPTRRKKPDGNVGPLRDSAVTDHDWYLVELRRANMTWAEIHQIWEGRTGVRRNPTYYRKRYRRMHDTYPDRVPALVDTKSKLKDGPLARPAHTEQDILAAMYGQPTFEDPVQDEKTESTTLTHPTTGGKTASPEMTQNTTLPRPTTGGKTISPEMAHYFGIREPTPESDTEAESETGPAVRRGLLKLVPKVRRELDYCYYVYTVQRQTVYPDCETEWVTVGRAFTSKSKANVEASHEKEKSRSDEGFKPMKTYEEVDENTGMYSCTATANDRTIHIRVQRRLENHVESPSLPGTDDWLPRRLFDVFEKRTVTTTITERVAIFGASTTALTGVVQDQEPDTNELNQEHEQDLEQEYEQGEVAHEDKDKDADQEERLATSDPNIAAVFDEWAQREETDSAHGDTAPEKHVRFAEDVKPPAKDVSDAAQGALSNTTAASMIPDATATVSLPGTHSINYDIAPTTTLREFTTPAITTTTSLIRPPSNSSSSSQPLYSTGHIANDAAITHILSLIHNPPADDASLCDLLPGKSALSLDRITYLKDMDELYNRKLDLADVTLDAQANEKGGEDLDGGLISEVIEGGGVRTVLESWPDVDDDDEQDDEDDEDDAVRGPEEDYMVKRAEREARAEVKKERKIKKWTFTRTVVEVWVQARTVEGPRNP